MKNEPKIKDTETAKLNISKVIFKEIFSSVSENRLKFNSLSLQTKLLLETKQFSVYLFYIDKIEEAFSLL